MKPGPCGRCGETPPQCAGGTSGMLVEGRSFRVCMICKMNRNATRRYFERRIAEGF